MLWGEQVLLGWFLLIAALSLNRMGPAFERSKYAGPIAALGIALILLVQEPPLYFESGGGRCVGEFTSLWCSKDLYGYYLDYILSLAAWLTLAYVGMRLIIRGSNWHTSSNPPVMIVGWFLVLGAWYILAQMEYYHWAIAKYQFVLSNTLAFLVGIVLASLLMFKVIQWTEIRTPRDEVIEGLSEREQRLVTELIRRNIGGGDR